MENEGGTSTQRQTAALDLRVVLTVMRQGQYMRTHSAPGRITIHVVVGHLRARVGEELLDRPTGRLLALDRAVRHGVEALDDSAFIITFA